MKIYTKIVMDLDTFEVLEEESFEYNGEIAALRWVDDPGDPWQPWTPDPWTPKKEEEEEEEETEKKSIITVPQPFGESKSTDWSMTGMDWDNPWISGSMEALYPGYTSFGVPGGTVPFSTSQSQSFQGMDWSNPYIQQLYSSVAPNISGFNIPLNLTPYSAAVSGDYATGQAGIDWSDPFASQILPYLTETAQGLPALAEDMGANLTTGYSNMLREALGPGAFQPTLQKLARRGMIDSTVASDALRGTAVDIARSVSEKAFEAQVRAKEAQMQVPTSLAEMVRLAQRSTEESRAQAQSYEEDPTRAYAIQGGYNTDMLKALADLGIISRSSTQAYQEDPVAQYGIMADYYPDMLNALANLGRISESRGESETYYEIPFPPK